MCLSTDRNIAAHVSVVFVFLQEGITKDQDLTQPLQDLRIVNDLMLDQLLRDGEQHLGAETQKGIGLINCADWTRISPCTG